MNIAIIRRPADPLSLRLYEANMTREICALGVEITPIPEEGPIPDVCDVLWDPGMCMRRIPSILRASGMPVVGTMHGVKSFALGLEELATGKQERIALARMKEQVAEDWAWFRDKAQRVVAVSAFAAREAVDAFGLPGDLVHVIHSGVDHSLFQPEGNAVQCGRPYFLHVSRLDPIKNIDRILTAYSALPEIDRPGFVAVVTSDKDQLSLAAEFGHTCAVAGVQWLREEIPQVELAQWYRGAVALVLPSLRETFGLPIIEAMASGCPVITSNSTGCAEVAGAAALLVDPRSVDDIAGAMQRMVSQPALLEALRQKGIERAKSFSWGRSAKETLRVMQAVVPPGRRRSPQMRKIEITTSAPCRVGCRFCPQDAFRRGYLQRGGAEVMSWETFVTSVGKLPATVGVSFGGMSEPFQNPRCADMILLAARHGHTVEVFTTLVGADRSSLERIVGAIPFGDSPMGNRIFVHLPSHDGLEAIPVTKEYRDIVCFLLGACPQAELHYHGSSIHEDLRALPLDGRARYWPIHNRADSGNRRVFAGDTQARGNQLRDEPRGQLPDA